MNLEQFRELKINDIVYIHGNAKARGGYATVKSIEKFRVSVEIAPGEIRQYSRKSLRPVTEADLTTATDILKAGLSIDDLMSVVKTLLIIRGNYEKKFGIIMYANGQTKKIETNAKPTTRSFEHSFMKERGASKYKERNIAIKKMRDAGALYKDIAAKYGISISQCRSVVILESRNEKFGYRD